MRYLLDTCVLSEFFKRQPDQNVIDWVEGETEQSQFLSVLTVGEIQKGITRLVPSKRKTELERWFGRTLIRYESRILDFDIHMARRWAAVTALLESKGCPLPLIDSLLAATAIENGLIIATRNESDFADTGAEVVNIWK